VATLNGAPVLLVVPFVGVAVTGLAFVLYGRAELAAERKSKGLCLRCGYDLRATPGRCPECEHVCGAR
jgi:hypothetical protein